MAPNPYDSCPCGSGKKFKWCCAPYFDQIEKAFDLDQQGQHEAAVRDDGGGRQRPPRQPAGLGLLRPPPVRSKATSRRPRRCWPRRSRLDPNFADGPPPPGIFRQNEGEVIGALMLFRKAAEAYDPEAHDQLAQVYEMIARNETHAQPPGRGPGGAGAGGPLPARRPGAARAVRGEFGDDSRLPECGPQEVRLPADGQAGRRGRRHRQARRRPEGVRGPDASRCRTTRPAWFNLGLVRAWLGEQPEAVEALKKSVELESGRRQAEEAAALVEVLRCGHGMEDDTDYTEYRVVHADPRPGGGVQAPPGRGTRNAASSPPQADPNGQFFSGLVVEELPSLLDTGTTLAKVVANLTIANGVLRLWHPTRESVEKVADEVRDRINLAVGEPVEGRGPVEFGDVAQEAWRTRRRRPTSPRPRRSSATTRRNYFEDVWAHRPLKSLGGATPLDAAGSKLLRKRLFGAGQVPGRLPDRGGPAQAGRRAGACRSRCTTSTGCGTSSGAEKQAARRRRRRSTSGGRSRRPSRKRRLRGDERGRPGRRCRRRTCRRRSWRRRCGRR